MTSLKDFLLTNEAPKELIAEVIEGVQRRSVPKGTIIQASGDSARFSFFVRKGLLRSYTIDDKGKEHVFLFAPEGWLVGDTESRTFNSPAVLFIDALEDSELEVLDSESLSAFDNLPKEVFKHQIEKLLRRVSVLQHRVLMLISASAAERYQDFVKTYPGIVQRVPQRMIASYLGITPEALSKIRGELART